MDTLANRPNRLTRPIPQPSATSVEAAEAAEAAEAEEHLRAWAAARRFAHAALIARGRARRAQAAGSEALARIFLEQARWRARRALYHLQAFRGGGMAPAIWEALNAC